LAELVAMAGAKAASRSRQNSHHFMTEGGGLSSQRCDRPAEAGDQTEKLHSPVHGDLPFDREQTIKAIPEGPRRPAQDGLGVRKGRESCRRL
ncbi:MAG: hypothetical protein RLZZ458_1002, partial [Planctomycetota bacterium]